MVGLEPRGPRGADDFQDTCANSVQTELAPYRDVVRATIVLLAARQRVHRRRRAGLDEESRADLHRVLARLRDTDTARAAA